MRAAVDAAASMIAEEISGSERDRDLTGLMPEAALHLPRDPAATIADVAEDSYQLSPQEIKKPAATWWARTWS